MIKRITSLTHCIAVASLAVAVARCPAQMVSGPNMPGCATTLGVPPDPRAAPYTAQFIESSALGNILWPGEQARFTFQLVIRRDGNMRLVEAAIPWAEMPEVKARLDAGQTIKFSFRVNDNAGGGCMELSRGRSVAKRIGSFLADWVEHWANEVEFGLER